MFWKLSKYLVNVGAIVSCSIIALQEFFPTETSSNSLLGISEVAARLSYSFVAAFIFYLLNVGLREELRRRKLYPFLAQNIKTLIGDGQVVFRQLGIEAGLPLELGSASQSTLSEVCKKVNPHAPAPILNEAMEPQSNMFLLTVQKLRSQETIRRCERITPWLDGELLSLLFRIDHCTYFMQLSGCVMHPIRNENLTFLAHSLYHYQMLLNELQGYADRQLSKYSKLYVGRL